MGKTKHGAAGLEPGAAQPETGSTEYPLSPTGGEGKYLGNFLGQPNLTYEPLAKVSLGLSF